MKKHLIIALAAVGLLATLNSCSKEEQGDLKPVKTAAVNPLDPDGYGWYRLPDGSTYYYEDSVVVFRDAQNPKYLSYKSLSLEKYKNGELLDSVCNKDIALRFESKARKSHNKEVSWGVKKEVVDEFPPMITINTDNSLTIKFSKMVTGFGYEYNSLYKDYQWSIKTTFRNSKLNKDIRPTFTTFIDDYSVGPIPLGVQGGARLNARESQTPFDEVTITFEGPAAEPAPGTFDISFAGFRYKLAK